MSYKPARRPNRIVEPLELPPIYFASGSNHAGEVKGFAALGQPMGAAVDKCKEPCLRAYETMAEAGFPVFMDSGAFSEVKPKFKRKRFVGFETVKPIGPAEWRRRLDIYHRLSEALGSLLYVVAPDKVGDQKETLRRLREYRGDVLRLINQGANVIVPLQRGPLPLSEFDRQVQRILGTDQYIPGFPMKKGATDPESIREFLLYRQPRAVHMLGLGEKNPNVQKVLDLVKEIAPRTHVTLDSVKISSQVGWEYAEYVERMEKRGLTPMPKKEWEPQHHMVLPGFRRAPALAPSPRALTLALHYVTPIRPHWGAQMYRRHQKDLGLEEFGVEVLDDREMVDRVDEWMDRKLRKEAVRQAGIHFYWNEYEDPCFDPQEVPPPELPWLPNASMWPMPQWGEKTSDSSLEDAFADALEEFMRSPREYIFGGYWFGNPDDYKTEPQWYEKAATFLRPLYLTALGRQKLPGGRGTVQSAYGKREALKAALGEGPEAQKFQQWREAMRVVPTQKDWEMLAALRFWKDPGLPKGPYELVPQEVVASTEATAYPEFDEVRLLHWNDLDQLRLEQRRLEALEWQLKRGTAKFKASDLEAADDWLGEALADVEFVDRDVDGGKMRLPATPQEAKRLNDYLKAVVEYRVARQKGGRAAVCPVGPKLPRLVGGSRVPDYQLAAFWHDPKMVAAANPRRKWGQRVANPRVLKRRLLR